jgi:hypothetical protein
MTQCSASFFGAFVAELHATLLPPCLPDQPTAVVWQASKEKAGGPKYSADASISAGRLQRLSCTHIGLLVLLFLGVQPNPISNGAGSFHLLKA